MYSVIGYSEMITTTQLVNRSISKLTSLSVFVMESI